MIIGYSDKLVLHSESIDKINFDYTKDQLQTIYKMIKLLSKTEDFVVYVNCDTSATPRCNHFNVGSNFQF